MPLFKKIKKLLTGEFIDELFDFGGHDLASLGTPPRPKTNQTYKEVCPYKVERFEGDCY